MVVIRVRPPLPREVQHDTFVNCVQVNREGRMITLSENLSPSGESVPGPYGTHTLTFDYVHDEHDTQEFVYETTAQAVVESSLQGYNATIFAYGQTGTGKTYTMEGFDSAEERGIIPRAIEQIFQHITRSVSPRKRFLVRASYLQIYNEVISDLLKPDRTNLVIREDKKKGVFVEGLSEWVVRSPQEIYGLMERGGSMRATGSTRMNHVSSRSHAVFIIIAEQSETTYLDEHGNELSVEQFHQLVRSRAHGDTGMQQLEANVRQSFKVGKLNLVDLAGSERVRLTGATGQRLEESKKINQSLSALGNVIAALTDPRGRQHIPYRDSKLTRILEDSLGGNCKTTMMAMISPALEAFVESLSTLKFANRAKNIKNEARVNEDVDQKSLLRRYERELKRLRTELEERSRSVVDQRRLLELDEQRRRAELDKMAAIRALEARSREFLREKEEKRLLEDRISSLESQMLIGGEKDGNPANLTDTPAFRDAIREHQEKIREEYETRLQELEKERETIEEEKAQVDRYKQLLLKQRDIMILLTQRLNERDDQIMALQDELDAYDRHQRDLEEKLDEKTAALIHLQRVIMEHNAASPVKSAALNEALGAWAGTSSVSRSGHHASPSPAHSARRTLHMDSKSGDPPSGGSGGSSWSPSGRSASYARAAAQRQQEAEGKTEEMRQQLEAKEEERRRMARELEDVRAEKVSLEYLLRERLEKLVQSEIEARLAAGEAPGGETSAKSAAESATAAAMAAAAAGGATVSDAGSLMQQLEERTAELRRVQREQQRAQEEMSRLREKLEELHSSRHGSGENGGDAVVGDGAIPEGYLHPELARSIRDRLHTHEKERKAIQTIMEQKIKTLVDNIVQLTATSATPTGSGSPNTERVVREARALQRLVHASVSALRNAEAEAAAAARADETLEERVAARRSAALRDGGFAARSPAATSSASSFARSHCASRGPPSREGDRNSSYAPWPSSSPSSRHRMPEQGTLTASGSPNRHAAPESVEAMIQQRKDELQRQRVAKSPAYH